MYRTLGRTALQVSTLSLGTMNFGPHADEPTSHDILDRAVEAGVNLIDTADQYGGSLGVGTTEGIIGNWLAADGARRDRIVLATKVYEPMSDDINDRGLSARHIVRGCEASLRRLNTDHLDLYQLHHLDRAASWEEVWQAMETLVAQGKVLYVGSSNLPGWSIAQANEVARSRSSFGLVSEQSLYNLAERTIELEVIPACEAYGVGLLAWSPLAGGLLAGGVRDAAAGRRATRRADALDRGRQVDDWEAVCAELGRPPAEVALAWLLHRPAVTSAIIGPRTPAQLESALRARDVDLDRDLLERLDEIFPGPGRAPEAYAW